MHLNLQSIDPSPLAALGVRMTSQKICSEFTGTTRETNPHALSFRAGARNLVYQNWRTADSSSLRLLGMTRCKVSRQASTNPKPLSFRAKPEICFWAKTIHDEPSRWV